MQDTPAPPSREAASHAPVLRLREDRHFTRFLFPFSFAERKREQTSWGAWLRAWWPFEKRRYSTFEYMARRIEQLTVAETPLAGLVKEKYQEQACWQPLESSEPAYILPHVASFVSPHRHGEAGDGPARYVVSYQLDRRFCRTLLPGQGKCAFVAKSDGAWVRFGVGVEDVQLYLFRSGIGVLLFDVALRERVARFSVFPFEEDGEGGFARVVAAAETRPLDTEHLALFNRGFRRLKVGAGSTCLYREEDVEKVEAASTSDGAPTSEETRYVKTYGRLRLSDLTRDLLTTAIGPQEDAASGEEGESHALEEEEPLTWSAFYRYRLLTYTFGLIDARAGGGETAATNLSYEQVREPLYRLRHSFDENYRPTETDLAARENEEVLRTFENIALGLSTEGGAVLAWDDDPEGTEFIQNQLHDKLRGPYFLMYLLALHQRLGSIHLAGLIGQANYHRRSPRTAPAAMQKRIRHLRERVFEFVVRCWFTEVSNMHIYTDVYRRWQEVLEVDPLLREVKSEVSELDNYLQRVVADRQRLVLNITTVLFFPLVLFTSIMGMEFDKLMAWSPHVWVWGGLGASAYFAGVAFYLLRSDE